MRRSELSLQCVPFDQLKSAIQSACGAGSEPDWTSPQLEYLDSYLRGEEAHARTLIIEKPYVDRHYLEEYGAYYFSSLRNDGSITTRVHIFAEHFDGEQLREWIHSAASGVPAKCQEVHERLDGVYLGFITVRPIPSAPIGRTILRPYGSKAARSYIPSEGGHDVHLLGLVLHARGLPFQQQEQAVGACATTALWSALSRVARADGGRSPTPFSVTQAATRHYMQDRALPAVSGLELAQLTGAVHELGYSPYVLKPKSEYATFVLSMKCYLRSGIPAVLVLEDENGGYHAVTASGYRLGDEEEPARDLLADFSDEGGTLVSKGISRVYVHDDRFGPYVRMKLQPPQAGRDDPLLERVPQAGNDPAKEAGGKVCYAIFPLYPKLRLTARELIGLGLDMLPIVRSLLDATERTRLNVECFFMQGGRYGGQLLALGLKEPDRVAEFVSGVALSRYVGIVRFQLDDAALVDVVCDTTDIRRDYPRRAPVIAVFPFSSKHVDPFRNHLARLAPWTIVV